MTELIVENRNNVCRWVFLALLVMTTLSLSAAPGPPLSLEQAASILKKNIPETGEHGIGGKHLRVLARKQGGETQRAAKALLPYYGRTRSLLESLHQPWINFAKRNGSPDDRYPGGCVSPWNPFTLHAWYKRNRDFFAFIRRVFQKNPALRSFDLITQASLGLNVISFGNGQPLVVRISNDPAVTFDHMPDGSENLVFTAAEGFSYQARQQTPYWWIATINWGAPLNEKAPPPFSLRVAHQGTTTFLLSKDGGVTWHDPHRGRRPLDLELFEWPQNSGEYNVVREMSGLFSLECGAARTPHNDHFPKAPLRNLTLRPACGWKLESGKMQERSFAGKKYLKLASVRATDNSVVIYWQPSGGCRPARLDKLAGGGLKVEFAAAGTCESGIVAGSLLLRCRMLGRHENWIVRIHGRKMTLQREK